MKCAYCENPLICEDCGVTFLTNTPESYEAISRCEEAIFCPNCEALLTCHWCKTPYDGETEAKTNQQDESGGEGPL